MMPHETWPLVLALTSPGGDARKNTQKHAMVACPRNLRTSCQVRVAIRGGAICTTVVPP
jgi:hypothetical protein